MSEISTEKRINPKITDAEIGIRELRNITLYPLSVGDQIELTDVIIETVQQFYLRAKDAPDDKEFVALITNLLRKHIGKLVGLITCGEESEEMLKEMSNEQLVDIALKVYEQNFECIRKNVKSLSKMIPSLSQSERPFPMSANTTEDTDLNTSTEETSSKEE